MSKVLKVMKLTRNRRNKKLSHNPKKEIKKNQLSKSSLKNKVVVRK